MFDLSKNSGGPGRQQDFFSVGAQMKVPTGERRRGRGGRVSGGSIPLPSRLGGLGERRELPSGVRAEPRPQTLFSIF